MSVYLCIPSARPDSGTVPVWREKGYKVALWRDIGAPAVEAHITVRGQYPGYSRACNALIELALCDPECDWVVCGGDDVLPDPMCSPGQIADGCSFHFSLLSGITADTFGVMQPTGDPWRDVQGRIIERIAGSPWIGRQFAQRINGGNGPWWPEYTHCFGDEELQNVACKLGVFWQRADLNQRHEHWAREGGDRNKMPAFLQDANSQAHWVKYKALFEVRKAGGFPGSELTA